ncbi:MAG: hypothetical protein H8E63_06455 [Proteobacteria bacterium]|nr:hypothetical protein [Pseudomonadota bacterium]
MLRLFMVALMVAAVVAIFLTTRRGKEIADQFGLMIPGKGRAPEEDHDYLLKVCGGDVDELKRRLDATRESNPELNEAGAYRRAIREHLKDKM